MSVHGDLWTASEPHGCTGDLVERLHQDHPSIEDVAEIVLDWIRTPGFPEALLEDG